MMLKKKKGSAELRDRMSNWAEAIGSVLRRNRLMWFGHVEKKEKGLYEEMPVYGGEVDCRNKAYQM